VTHKPTTRPSQGNQSASAGQCSALKARAPAIEACPPPNLSLEHPVVSRDPTVADTDAQHAVEGFARSYAIYNWAINHGYVNFIRSGLISFTTGQAETVSFGTDLDQLDEARREEAVFKIDPPLKLVSARAEPLSPQVAAYARQSGLATGAVGLRLTFQGPYGAYIGNRAVTSHPSSFVVRVVMFGELRNDADLGGWLWVWGGYASCNAPQVADACAA